MAVGLRHLTLSVKADDPDYEVSKDEWNEDHLLLKGLIAERPSASIDGRLYHAYDEEITYRDFETHWKEIARSQAVTDHNALLNYNANEHVQLPNTIANVLNDHNVAAHNALNIDHDSLSNVSVNDHHNQLHANDHHGGGNQPVDHNQLQNYAANEHLALPSTIVNVLSDHNLSNHVLGTIVPHDNLADLNEKSHGSLTNITTGQHHAKNHATRHNLGGGDELNHDNLAGFVSAEHLNLPSSPNAVLSAGDWTGNWNVSGYLAVDNVKVVGNRGAAIADIGQVGADQDGDLRAKFNTLLSRLRAHGLIAS